MRIGIDKKQTIRRKRAFAKQILVRLSWKIRKKKPQAIRVGAGGFMFSRKNVIEERKLVK